MTTPPRKRAPMAGGFLLAMSIIAGTILGGLRGEPSAGFIAGGILGLVLLLVAWLVDRARGA